LAGWVKLQLDLTTFENAPFQPYLRRSERSGLCFTTVAKVGDNPISHRALYELTKTCSADIPGRGEFYTFEQYLSERINVPSYDPQGIVLAIDHGTWIGMAATSIHPERDFAFSEMTGVLATYRGQGVSIAMKLLAIEYVRGERRLRWLRAFHHPTNTPAIAMNRRLGFVDEDPRIWTS
jgi:RimJ/RimL family protein N-acetyltransferase